MTRLTHALNTARELWHLATLAWLDAVLEQHAAYLNRENP